MEVPRPGKPNPVLRVAQKVCPHVLGWQVIPSGRRRFCNVCGVQQRRVGAVWVTVNRRPWL